MYDRMKSRESKRRVKQLELKDVLEQTIIDNKVFSEEARAMKVNEELAKNELIKAEIKKIEGLKR